MSLHPPVTITLNPAIDVFLSVDRLKAGSLNRIGDSVSMPAGKGLNVSRSLALLNVPHIATGFLPNSDEQFFSESFDVRITDQFIRVPGAVRHCYKVLDESLQQVTELNEQGARIEQSHLDELEQTIGKLAQQKRWFVLSGSLPAGVPSDYYEKLICQIKNAGSHALLDTSGEALVQGVRALPDLIKPNQDEFEQLTGSTLTSIFEVSGHSRTLIESGVGEVVVSMGSKGAAFVNSEKSVVVEQPKIDVVCTVGAGDSMVAGLIRGKMVGLVNEQLLVYSVACALSCIQHKLPTLQNKSAVETFCDKVVLHDSPKNH